MSGFFNQSELDKILPDVVKKTFPNLNVEQQKKLDQYIKFLIQYIALCFDFYDDSNNFKIKLKQNNYKDCRWLLTFLIPYIDTDKKGFDELTDLNQLYSLETSSSLDKKTPEAVTHLLERDLKRGVKIDRISFTSPEYVFSNTQYGRFDKSGGTYKPVRFDYSHIRQNFYLMLDTIKKIRYKMYVNWIDVIPYRIDNYKDSALYRTTVSKITKTHPYIRLEEWDPISDYPIDKYDDPRVLSKFSEKMAGLNIEDIYNTISMDLYESIVKFKWLIFDVSVDESGMNKVIPLIVMLRHLLPLDIMLKGVKYIELEESTRSLFSTGYTKLVTAYKESYPIGGSDPKTSIFFKTGAVDTCINALVLFFDQKHANINSEQIKKYVPLDESIKRRNLEDYDQSRLYDKKIISKTLDTIDEHLIYKFIVDALEGFKNTWYATKLLNDDKSDIAITKTNYMYFKKSDKIYITFKNVYNFCKSLVHRQKGTKKLTIINMENKNTTELYVRYPKVWSELDETAKDEIIKRLNSEYENSLDWFNIYWNIFHVTKAYEPSIYNTPEVKAEIIKHNVMIYDHLKISIIDIIFESMIMRGVMSRMIAVPEFTNASLYDMSNNMQKKKLVDKIATMYFGKNSPFMNSAYYYLINKPYSKTTTYMIKDDDDKMMKNDYIKACSNPSLAYYINIPFHWIAQIGFCHRFIHNRVNYITGSTGAGKSTEVPKLYMYYLKSIDRNDNGTVIITVPRTGVATSVSKYVSNQLGLPYDVYDNKGVEEKSTNYTIQFKHKSGGDEKQNKIHTKNGKFLKSRFITDGSVLTDVKNPLLRSTRIKGSDIVYNRENMYDVIIIDEAHEHNANMDMILSMIKNAAFYNNSIRIVIMSATMGNDEPVYRRFYRDINDNRKYPLSNWIVKHGLDRINTERRFHISPPDISTRFPIEEYYNPGANPIDIIKQILSSSSSGDILVFQSGSAEITELVTELNFEQNIPSDAIALPYHAKMATNKKDIILKIDKNISKLRFSKADDFAFVNDPFSGTSKYSRAIIVSTNISEASVTFPSLKYVVDTGKEKTNIFDYKTRTDILTSNYITEASRLQRKGRVGRKSPGTVFYTYREGELLSNKKQFNIAVQDSHMSIYLSLLRDQTDLPIFTPLVMALVEGMLDNYIDTQITIPIPSTNIRDLIKASYDPVSYNDEFVRSIVDVIIELYTSNGYYYDYVGEFYSNTTFDLSEEGKMEKIFPYPVYFSGYDSDQLTDTQGRFYIVHPDELIFGRNINGDVISVDNDTIELVNKSNKSNISKQILIQNQCMRSKKIKAFWSTLFDNRYCVITDNVISKTRVGAIMEYAMTKLSDFDNPYYAKMLVIAYAITDDIREFDHLLCIITYMEILGAKSAVRKMFVSRPALNAYYYNLSMKLGKVMTPSNREILSFTKELFSDTNVISGGPDICKSDYAIISNVVYLIDAIIRGDSKITTFSDYIIKQKEKVKNNILHTNILKIVDGLTVELGIDDEMLEFREDAMKNWIDIYVKTQLQQLAETKRHKLLNDIGLDLNMCKRYIAKRETTRNKFNDMIKDIDGFNRRKNDQFNTISDIQEEFKDVKKHIKNMKKHIKNGSSKSMAVFKVALVLSMPYSIVRKIKGTDAHYVSVYSPDITTIYSIDSLSRNKYYRDTYVDAIALEEYVHYTKSNSDTQGISNLTSLTYSDLEYVNKIYASLADKQYGDSMRSTEEESKYLKHHLEMRYKKRYPDPNKIDGATDTSIIPVVSESDELTAILKMKNTVHAIKSDLRYLKAGHSLTDQTQMDDIETIIWH